MESPGPHERVLIVDDSAEQRELALVTLKELGYTAVAAASGEQGMELLKQDRFDLVLLDMILGQGMDGLDTYRQILAHAPEQKVLIVSGYAENQRIAEALRLGARGYVKKPYTVVELAQAMRRALAHP
jgi:Response regulator containing CheY-like receiver, AAA-type ATPase, and DNA-binding domains